MCDRYAASDGRVEVCHTENRGSVAARRLGLSCSVGEYISFVDADDYVEPDMFELLWNEIRDSGADFVHMGYIREKDGKSEAVHGFREGTFDLPDMAGRENVLAQYVFQLEEDRSLSHLHHMERVMAEPGLQYHLLKILRDYDPSVYRRLQDHICRFLINRGIVRMALGGD